ncbi:hypothetical protein D9M71_833880 [compost metagenome]
MSSPADSSTSATVFSPESTTVSVIVFGVSEARGAVFSLTESTTSFIASDALSAYSLTVSFAFSAYSEARSIIGSEASFTFSIVSSAKASAFSI